MYSLGILINQYSYIQHFHVMSLHYQSNAGFINYFQGSYSLGGHLQIPWFFPYLHANLIFVLVHDF